MSRKEINKILDNLYNIEDYNKIAEKYNEQANRFSAMQEATNNMLYEVDNLVRETNRYYCIALRYYQALCLELYEQKSIKQVKSILDDNAESINERYEEFNTIQKEWESRFGPRGGTDEGNNTEI